MKILLISILFSLGLSNIKLGDPAPTFFTRTIDNKSFFMSDTLKKNNPIVLSFFATWCEPCKKEMPILDSLSTVYKGVDFYFVNVSGLMQGKRKLKEDPKIVSKMIKAMDIKSPILMDKYGKTAEKYGVSVLPRLVAIDSKGNISYIHDGYKKNDELKLIEIIDNDKK